MADIFQPIRGLEESINQVPIREGFVYFAYDSGNIYMDKDGQRYLMGGSSTGFTWASGNKNTIVKISDDDADQTYRISFSCLDGNVVPKPDSLILNSDGRFFRILSVDLNTNTLVASLVAISGSGGGSGGGDTPVVQRDVDISWDDSTIQTGTTYIYGQSYDAIFIPTNTVGDLNCTVTFNILDRINDTTTSITQVGRAGQRMRFNMGQLPKSTNITLQVIVTSDNSQYNDGAGYTRNITNLKVVEMGIQKPGIDSYIPLVKADDLSGTLNLSYMPLGEKDSNGQALLNETLHVYVDDIEVLSLKKQVPVSYYNRIDTVSIPRQSHGVHEISFRISALVGSSEIYTAPITYEGAWAAPEDNTPIIWIGQYDSTIVNYENSYVSYMVFDPINYANGLPAEIHLYKENVEVSQISAKYSDDGWLIWDISNLYEVGNNNLSISCRTTKVNIPIFVTTEGSRDLGLVATSSLLLNMTTAGRSSTEIRSQRSVFNSLVNSNNITVNLNDFNWQNNGWKDSEGLDKDGVDSGSYLSVANGSSLDVTLTNGGLVLNQAKDYSFEFRFRVSNVQEYSTLIKTIPKYFYDFWDSENEVWVQTYTISIVDDEEVATIKEGYTSLYESEIKNNPNYRFGVDKYGNLLMDEKNTKKEVDISSGVVVKWLSDAGYGFCIGTQEAYFKTPSEVTNVRYCEDEVINLTFVVSKTDGLCYIYLNGILSGAAKMPTGAGSSFTINTPFEFNSEYCDFDLYRFRVYELGLTMPQVIHNYLSDMHSIKLYDQNQITDPLDATSLSYNLLVQYNNENPGNQSMPYVTWQITDGDNELLPYKKGNKRKATIEFINPCLDEALQLFIDTNGAQGIDEWYYYTHSPSYYAENVEIDVQGTSSQKYPRRNYKTKFKSAGDTWVYKKGSLAGQPLTGKYTITDKNGIEHSLSSKFHEDAIYGVNKFTWKIDYMESSETYNTGFANLMGNLSHPLYTKHPLDDLDLGINTNNLRTSVYGYPVLTFHKYANGDYEYIGKYNMNLDKGANEAYGFEDKTTHPFVNTRIKKVKNSETGLYEDVEYQPTIAEIAECWEMKDNQGYWCSFKYPNQEARNTGYMTLKEGTSGDSAQLEILNHYEYRYSFYADELDNAYEYAAFTDANTQVAYANNGQINSYLYEKHSNLEKLFNWLDSTDQNTATNELLKDANNNVITVTYNVSSTVNDDESVSYQLVSEGSWNATFTKDTKEYRRQKFRSEFAEHLDLEYCLTYFVLTELLLCYDSRGKNMMLASFGPHRRGGEYIWYPIFYDIDTQLGLNNSGAYLWDYDADVTKDNLFSTPTSVLWNNLYDIFYDDVVRKYRVLRGLSNVSGSDLLINGNLTEKNIVGAYICDPAVFDSYAMRGVRPIVAIGLDEYYKYLAPALKATDYARGKYYAGYYDTGGNHLYQEYPIYSYCAQGDKKLTTELLIRNRLNYLDSQWMAGNYTAGVVENQIFLRANANLSTSSDKFLDSASRPGFTTQTYPVDYFDARPGAKIKPYLHQYISYFHDSQPSIPKKYDANSDPDGEWTNVDPGKLEGYKNEPDLSQQITYFPGGDYISSLGDLSLMYPNALQFFHAKRMLDFRLGSDIPGYSNPGMDSNVECELSEMPLLKMVNLSNLSSFGRELSFLSSAKLQEFRALGSVIERVNFAPGAPLHTVHLPNTMTTVSLVQHKNLNKILTSRPVVVALNNETGKYDYQPAASYEGLYIEGVTDYTPDKAGTGHKLVTYEVQSGGLGYNSYIILKNLYNLKYGASSNQYLRASLTDVHWTPYDLVEMGTAYNINEHYYLLNDHSSFEDYEFTTPENWISDLLNEKVYTYNSEYTQYDPEDNSTNNAEECTITDLSLLDNFITAYNLAVTNHTESQFANTSGSTSATVPTITGTMFVSNDSNNKINEASLTSTYKTYFPNLTIHVANVREANITKYIRVYENGKIETLAMERTDGDVPLQPQVSAPTQTDYDFAGWSLDNPNEVNEPTIALAYNLNSATYSTTTIWNNLRFTEDDNVITLYAIFVPHPYIMTYKYKDGTLIEEVPSPFSKENGSIKQPSIIPYIDESGLSIDRKYAFLGYTQNPDTNELFDFSSRASDRDLLFYAVFEEMNVFDDIAKQEYFNFTLVEGGYADDIDGYRDENQQPIIFDSSYNVSGPACTIGLKPGLILSGKIVLPKACTIEYPINSGVMREVPVIGISSNGFENIETITHVFFEPNNVYRTIGSSAFFVSRNANSSLKYVDFTNTGAGIRVIMNQAFSNCRQLSSYELPPHLLDLYGGAFEACFDGQNDICIRLGSDIVRIGTQALSQLYLGSNCELWIGSSENPSNINFSIPGTYNGVGNSTRRPKRILQNTNGTYARVEFWSANYTKESEVTMFGLYGPMSVTSAFDLSDMDVLTINGE